MKKFEPKKSVVFTLIIVFLGIFEFIGVLPYITARVTASIYVVTNYSSMGLSFDSAEYAYSFGDYSVRYKDRYGKTVGFMLFPKEFPVFIRYDSIKGES